jgi:hypothetical protein
MNDKFHNSKIKVSSKFSTKCNKIPYNSIQFNSIQFSKAGVYLTAGSTVKPPIIKPAQEHKYNTTK